MNAISSTLRNAKLLYKKITLNSVMKQSFKKLLIERDLISEEVQTKFEYLADLILLNILDQIFVQTVYEPFMSDIIDCL